MFGKITENWRSSSAPPDTQNKKVNHTTNCYQSCGYIRPSHQRHWPCLRHPDSGLWTPDASLIDHHQSVNVVITERGEMFLPRGTHTKLDIMIEGTAQESGDFCLEFIGVV